jgi:hypothetical protein
MNPEPNNNSETAKKSPLVWLLIFLLLAALSFLGLKFYEAEEQLRNLKSELSTVKTDLAAREKQIEAAEKLAKLPNDLCTPSPQDASDPEAPCAKCVSVLSKITPSQASHAIELGKELVAAYNSDPGKIEYKDFYETLVKAANQMAHGDKVLLESEQKKVMDQKDAQIAALQHDKDELLKNLQAGGVAEAELQKCLASSNYLIRKTTLDQPPCWTSEDGNLQYLFDLTLLPDDKVIVRPAWPQEREQDANDMAPVRQLMPYFNEQMPMSSFMKQAYGILEIGKQNKPETCRFFVRMKSEIEDRATADKARLTIENAFYKFERTK